MPIDIELDNGNIDITSAVGQPWIVDRDVESLLCKSSGNTYNIVDANPIILKKEKKLYFRRQVSLLYPMKDTNITLYGVVFTETKNLSSKNYFVRMDDLKKLVMAFL